MNMGCEDSKIISRYNWSRRRKLRVRIRKSDGKEEEKQLASKRVPLQASHGDGGKRYRNQTVNGSTTVGGRKKCGRVQMGIPQAAIPATGGQKRRKRCDQRKAPWVAEARDKEGQGNEKKNTR